jgi:high frequency lysogenization protein
MKTDFDRLLALAGVFQSAYLVDQIARTGMADSEAIETTIYSIFQTEPESIEAVFKDRQHLKNGLQCLISQMMEHKAERIDITRYAIQLMHLSGKLFKKSDRIQKLASGIEIAKARLESFSISHMNILAQLADLYVDNVSDLAGRIMVNGEPVHLNNPDNVHKIRALLLGGIRAAWLWHQCGGKRRHLVFSRKKIHNQAVALLEEINGPSV